MAQHDLELYVLTGCPFCRKVLDYMEANGIEIPIRNISTNAEDRTRLIEVGGKAQCPCLFIDGTPMYESDEIVAWLKGNIA